MNPMINPGLHFPGWVLQTSWQAAVLVVLIVSAQWLLRTRLSAGWRYALWLLLVVRLLMPGLPRAQFSVFNVAKVFPQTEHPQTTPSRVPAAKAAEPIVSKTVQVLERPPIDTPADSGVAPVSSQTPAVAIAPPQTVSFSRRSEPAKPSIAPKRPVDWWRVGIGVWLSVAALLGLRLAGVNIRFALRISRLLPSREGRLTRLVEECRVKTGLRSKPIVVESDLVATPAVYGLVRKRLLIPNGMTDSFSDDELRHVIAHELAHLKRWDLEVNWLTAWLAVLHWFNPFIWFAFRRMRADRELATDALAISSLRGDDAVPYGETILKVLEQLRRHPAMPGLVGIGEDKSQIARRLRAIAGYGRTRPWTAVAFMTLAALAAFALTDSKPGTQTPKAKPETSSSTGATPAKAREIRHGADPLPTENGTNLASQTMVIEVLDAEAGTPIAEANIDAPIGDWRKMPKRLTDKQGRYELRIPALPPEARSRMGNINFTITHSNFAPRGVAWTSSSGDVYATLPERVTVKMARGIRIGGVVRDTNGAPLPGVKVLLSGSDYRGFNMGTSEKLAHEYAQLYLMDTAEPAAVTDGSGKWIFDHCPSELENLEVTFLRPDQSRESFSTAESQPLNYRPPISLAELKQSSAISILRGGVTVRGRVVDEAGRPVPGALMKEGYGHGNIQRIAEFITDQEGRFEQINRAPRQWIYTGVKEGHATASVVAEVEPGMKEFTLMLPRAKPLRLRFVDENKKTIAGTEIQLDSYRNEAQILDWEAKTDADGRAVWTNAPLTLTTLYAFANGRGRKFKTQPTGDEQQIIIPSKPPQQVHARLRAVDANTGEPVKMKTVSVSLNGDFKGKVLDHPDSAEYTAEIKLADIRVGMYPSFTLSISADGYEPITTEQLDIDEGDRDVKVMFTRASIPSELSVWLPDGKPAAGARVYVRAHDNGSAVFANAPQRYYADSWEKALAGNDGSVKLPPGEATAPIVIVHTNGFIEMRMAEIKGKHEVKLQPWAQIDGRLVIGGKPKGGVMIYLSDLVQPFHLIYNTTTAEDGSFTFTNVPAGNEYILYRRYNNRMGTITPSHQMPITLRAGERLKLEYAIAGRRVVGQAVPDLDNAIVDWLNDTQVLAEKSYATPIRASREDFATFAAFKAANDAAIKATTLGLAHGQGRTYELVFERDGSFAIDDVPPGEYELRIKVTKRNDRSAFGHARSDDELGSLLRTIVIPAGTEPFDLGTVVVAMKPLDALPKSGTMALKAKLLDGKEINLSSFRGHPTLVTFWASWSKQSTAQLAELIKLRREFAGAGEFSFLSINIDDDVSTARQASELLGSDWTRAHAAGRDRAEATTAFGVDALPAVYLLDRDGRIAARDLEGDRVRTTLQRFAKKRL